MGTRARQPDPENLAEWPVSRLIVELDSAERTLGANSVTARTLASVLRERLRRDGRKKPEPCEVGK